MFTSALSYEICKKKKKNPRKHYYVRPIIIGPSMPISLNLQAFLKRVALLLSVQVLLSRKALSAALNEQK